MQIAMVKLEIQQVHLKRCSDSHPKEGNSSYFAGTGVEVMKAPYKGTNGHIAVSTNYIDRAVSYLEMLGYEFDMSTAKYDAKNNLKAVYFTGEVGGFAVHLVQK